MTTYAPIGPDLIDRMIELYCEWRTACWDVRAAYGRFGDASGGDRALAFGAYIAALDREQSASESYAAQIALIESRWAEAHRVTAGASCPE